YFLSPLFVSWPFFKAMLIVDEIIQSRAATDMAKSGKTAQYARRALGLLVLCAVMTGCAGYESHTTATISSGDGYAYLYGDDDPWRYHENDWIYYYPGCCADRDELQERLQDWWQAQDPARQQAIKDHVGHWNERHFAANVPALQQQLDRRWHSMSAEQQMNARQRWQARPVSKHTPNSVLRESAHDPALQLQRTRSSALSPQKLPAHTMRPATRSGVVPAPKPVRPMSAPRGRWR
ncbi:MAG: hypothetical protein ACRCYD_10955, partial [Plesiomonas sp.]